VLGLPGLAWDGPIRDAGPEGPVVKEIAGVTITWSEWFVGFLPIGLVLFVALPALVYVFYPPAVKASPEVTVWARQELDRMETSRVAKCLGLGIPDLRVLHPH